MLNTFLVIRTMTVYETLFFSARTRLSWRKSLGEIKSIVNRVIKILGLEDIKNSIIGDEKQRGISGGQRKRVNIGMELVAQPSLLLLDEPTSGLDSSASQEVCSALRKIANCGITVLTVIHQPRFEIFNLFDNVLFLAKGGFTVYFGPTERVQTYFEKLGFELPNSVNPPDFYLDIISGTEKSKFGETVNLIDAWQNHVLLQEEQEQTAKAEFVVVESHDVTENNDEIQGSSVNLTSIQQQDGNSIPIENNNTNYYNTVNKTKYIPRATSPIVQFIFAFIRTLIQQGRDWTSFIIDNGLIFVGGIFLSISVFGERFEGALDAELCTGMPEQLRFTCNVPLNDIALKIASLLPPIMIMSGVMASIGTFSNERVVYIRESMSGLNTFSYFLAKNVSNIPNIIVAPFVFLCVFQFFAAP